MKYFCFAYRYKIVYSSWSCCTFLIYSDSEFDIFFDMCYFWSVLFVMFLVSVICSSMMQWCS